MTTAGGVRSPCPAGLHKGVGPSTTLAWPGWKQPDVAVKVDGHDLKQAGSKNVV